MIPLARIAFLVGLLLGSQSTLFAKTIVLGVGESYTEDDLNVMCVEQKSEALIELRDCQFWDDFNDRCLYEKTVYTYGDLECVERCQHWDKFKEVCHFATQCTFHPSAGVFVETTCEEFDEFKNVCKRTKQKKISGKYK